MLIAILIMTTLSFLSFIFLVGFCAWVVYSGDKEQKKRKEWEAQKRASHKEDDTI